MFDGDLACVRNGAEVVFANVVYRRGYTASFEMMLSTRPTATEL